MGFYTEWHSNIGDPILEKSFILSFLNRSSEATTHLIEGNEPELDAAFTALSSTPMELFLETLVKLPESPELSSSNIPCFSNFINGASRLNELLEFHPDGLTFEALGHLLANSVSYAAKNKYGENHSKLAELMSLVYFENTRPIIVHPTAWGSYLTRYEFVDKTEALRKTLLRDTCISTIIRLAMQGKVYYQDIVPFLSKATMIRRRPNVRCLVSFVLEGSSFEHLLRNIIWDIEAE